MENILELFQISKSFPGVQALKDVDFFLRKGEVHALVGENGAGKSTLVKIIMGVHQPDSGKIVLEGKEVKIHDPNHARSLGISAIHQELAVFPDLTVLENLFIGWQPGKFGFVNWKRMREMAETKMKEVGINLPLDEEVGNLSTAQQELVQILRALLQNSKIIIMDEPTASLTADETKVLFSTVRRLKNHGVSVIYISHRLEEVFEIADNVTILRDGVKVLDKAVKDITPSELIENMIGRKLETYYPPKKAKPGEVMLEVKGISFDGILKNISFKAHKGEILGISGLLGSGRSTLAKIIFGILKPDDGSIYLEGKEVKINNPMKASMLGIAYIPEDRHRQGLILPETVRFNISLPNLPVIPRKVLVDIAKEKELSQEMVRRLDIRTPSVEFLTMNLSGGNQQKVVLAKWILRNSKILIMDEPTHGIDVGAKNAIYHLMVNLAEQGRTIIFISSELPELLGMCDRILVMRKGEIVGVFNRGEFSEDRILALAAGFAEKEAVGGAGG